MIAKSSKLKTLKTQFSDSNCYEVCRLLIEDKSLEGRQEQNLVDQMMYGLMAVYKRDAPVIKKLMETPSTWERAKKPPRQDVFAGSEPAKEPCDGCGDEKKEGKADGEKKQQAITEDEKLQEVQVFLKGKGIDYDKRIKDADKLLEKYKKKL